MRRVTLILAILGILCVAVGQVQAHGYHHNHGPAYYHGYRGPVVMRPPVVIAPPIYPPIYRPRCYEPVPYYGFYYQGRGLSIGVGF
jgi:hypothetical protein